MVRLIMGDQGSGKTKRLIEMVNEAAAAEKGNVVCIEAKPTMTFDVHYHVRLISAKEYQINGYESLRGFLSGLYAGNYDISQVFIDNLFKIVDGECNQDADNFLAWLDGFSETHGVRFTVAVSRDESQATDGMKKFL